MAFDSDKYPRHSFRLKGYDYGLPGGYFVTIVTQDRRSIFGKIINDQIELNDIGKLVQSCWLRIPEFFDFVGLDEFTLMPNHLHKIIFIHEASGSGECFAPRTCWNATRVTWRDHPEIQISEHSKGE